jgi:hypothetical protein
MRKELIPVTFIVIFFTSCEEYYKPSLDVGQSMLVVESSLSNDSLHNFVKLTATTNFYSPRQFETVYGAQIKLMEIGGPIVDGTESTAGYFTFSRTPIAGKKYKIRISYIADTFESDTVIMPPLPTIDTLYTLNAIEKSYKTDIYGVPSQVETPGRNICIDEQMTSTLQYNLFNWRAILQWVYNPPSKGGPAPPSWYGWLSTYSSGEFNLAGPKIFTTTDQIKAHPVLFIPYDSQSFLDSIKQSPMGWIVIIDQYGITKASNDFHEQLNKQFTADGSLFDPILTQVTGNIHCLNNPDKIALGFFDLNSYRQYRYFISLGYSELGTVIQRRINRNMAIPDQGYYVGDFPPFWEYLY